ncbi:MAG: hypothetical protein WB359_19155, partial [Bryobacteraceae bacterium]
KVLLAFQGIGFSLKPSLRAKEQTKVSMMSPVQSVHDVAGPDQPVPARLKPCPDTRPVFSWFSVVEVQLRRS